MTIYLSCGDCNGIGLEVGIKALHANARNWATRGISFLLGCNSKVLQQYIASTNLPAQVQYGMLELDGLNIGIDECETDAFIRFGEVQLDAGKLAYEALERSVAAVQKGSAHAVVTLPVSKHSLYAAGFVFPGQTEFFAARAGGQSPLMILFHESLRVSLATIHVPLTEVANNLNLQSLQQSMELFNNSLRDDFGIAQPRIAVLGLNPHAGEAATIGTEELEFISPAIDASNSSLTISDIARDVFEGPFAADGFFANGEYMKYDGIMAMYHDQGLIPIKLLSRGEAVNFSAGLSIVRTSPDHGTAFSLAGKNLANEQSTVNAIEAAIDIASRRTQSSR